MKGFIVGLIAGVILVPACLYVYFATGHAPVATSAPPMPFEKTLARMALHARMKKEIKENPSFNADEGALISGAMIYKDNCAACHGLPGQKKTNIAAGMYPPPPQLFMGKGVTDDTPGETYWKVANGIRLTGMPGFKSTLSDDQMWQVSFLLAKAHELPASVQQSLAGTVPAAEPAAAATSAPKKK